MNTWLTLILSYAIVAFGCYVATLVFLRPQPLIVEPDPSDSELRPAPKLCSPLRVIEGIVGVALMLIFAPPILVVGLWMRKKKRRDGAG